MNEPGGKRPTVRTAAVSRGWLVTLSLAFAVSLAACGDDASDEQAVTTAATQTATEDTPTPSSTTSRPADPDGDDAGPVDTGQEGGSTGGSAMITISGETVEFDSFTCFHGDAAAEEFDNDDIAFAALGQIETDTGTSTVAVSSVDSALGPVNAILYVALRDPSGVTDLAWQLTGDEVVVDGDRITGDGAYSEIVGGEHTDETADGAFEATCG